MSKYIINSKKSEFIPGQTFRATVKAVHEMGVQVKMPGGHGSGIISARCWGSGVEREKALAAICPGDEFDVVVNIYDKRARTLSLVLVGCEHLRLSSRKNQKAVRQIARQSQGSASPRKPEFQPIAPGTVLLCDASNLLGAIGPENAARTLVTFAEKLSEQGYGTMFFIERRCLTWARYNQRTPADAADLDRFAQRDDVVVVEGGGSGTAEADCAILQMAEALPGSVCLSRDHFGDYACAYPGIVGTTRIRPFSIAKAYGKTMILVNGLEHAIAVDDDRARVEVVPSADSPAVTVNHSGMFAVADECVRRGDVQGALRIYARLGKRNPVAYRALAEMYRGGNAVCADGKKAAHYERLARTAEKARRESSVRYRRLRAEAIRAGRHGGSHFSAKRHRALGFVIFAGRHEAIGEYLKFRRDRMRNDIRVHGRAA